VASRNAKGRMIYWKISYCKQLVRCSLFAQLLFTWLIPNADDLGRLEGDPEVIKGMIFPYHKITPKQIGNALTELHREGLIIWYQINESRYIQIPNFTIYQKLRKDREYSSDYPEPDSDMTSHDMTCHDGQNLREGEGKEKVSEGEGKGKGSEGEGETTQTPFIKCQHLSMTKEEYDTLVLKYGQKAVDDKIEYARNYKKLKNYISLYLTLNNWLKKDKQDKPAKATGNIFLEDDV
jgi:hypothetical protein